MMTEICSQPKNRVVEATGEEKIAMTRATPFSLVGMILMSIMTTTAMEYLELTPKQMFLMRISGAMVLDKWE